MTTREELESLVRFLQYKAEEHTITARRYNNDYIQGYADAYKLCAKWLTNILKTEN